MDASEKPLVVWQRIVTNIKKRSLSSLSQDVKVYIETRCKDRTQASNIASILIYICDYLKNTTNLLPCDKDAICHCIQHCVEFFRVNYSPHVIRNTKELKFEQSLYHIINSFVKLGLREDVLHLSNILREHIRVFRVSEDNLLTSISSNMFAILWNCAAGIEVDSDEVDEQKYQLALSLRIIALKCLSLLENGFSKFCHKCEIALQRYCMLPESMYQIEPVQNFLMAVWTEMSKYMSYCDKYCAKLLIFELFCNWLISLTLKKFVPSDILHEIVQLFLKFNSTAGHAKCCHSQMLNASIDIATFCLSCVDEDVKCPNLGVIEQHSKLLTTSTEHAETLCITWDMVAAVFYYGVQAVPSNDDNAWKAILKIMQDKIPVIYILITMYVRIFNKGRLNRDMRVRLIASLLKVIFRLGLDYDDDKVFRTVISVGHALVKLLNEEILQKSCSLLSTEIPFLAQIVSRLGRLCYKKQYHMAAIPFFELVINISILDESETNSWWKDQELLTKCYIVTGSYVSVLHSLAKAFLRDGHNIKSGFQFWVEAKQKAMELSSTLLKCTICDVFKELNIVIDPGKEVSFLWEELHALRSFSKYSAKEEVVAVCSQLLEYCSDDVSRGRIFTHLAQLSLSSSEIQCFKLQRSIPSDTSVASFLCREAITSFENALEDNRDCPIMQMYFSITLFWTYHYDAIELRDLAEKELNKSKDTVEPQEAEDGEEIETHDMKTAFAHITSVVETEVLRSLQRAVDIWKEVSKKLCNIDASVFQSIYEWGILEVIKASAEIYMAALNDTMALTTWLLLHKFATHANNENYKFQALQSVVSLLSNSGYMEVAKHVIDYLEENILIALDLDSKSTALLQQKFFYSKCVFFLQTEQFDKGYKLLREILENVHQKQRTRDVLIITIEATALLSRYLLLPNSAFTKETVKAGPGSHAISAITYCFIKCQRHMKIELSAFHENFLSKDWIWRMVSLYLRCAYIGGRLCLEIGDLSKASFFLKEGLTTAQSVTLTKWSAKFLVALSEVDLMSNKIDSCEVKLSSIEHMIKYGQKHRSTKAEDNLDCSRSSDESEHTFLVTRSDVNAKTEARLKFLERCQSVWFSPITHERRKAVRPEIKLETNKCRCHRCTLCSMNFVQLEGNFLKCLYLIEKGVITNVGYDLALLRSGYKEFTEQQNANFSDIIHSFFNDIYTGSFQRSAQCSELGVFIRILLQQAVLSLHSGDFVTASVHVNEAMSNLVSSYTLPKLSSAVLYSLIMYYKAVASVTALLNVYPSLNLFSPFFATFRTDELNSSSRCSYIVDAVGTPKNQGIPKINVTDFSGSIHSTVNLCKAPVKKDIIPITMREAFSKMALSTGATSDDELQVSFSESGTDDCAFISPTAPATAKDRKKQKTPYAVKTRSHRRLSKQFDDSPKTPNVTLRKQSSRRNNLPDIQKIKTTKKPEPPKIIKSKETGANEQKFINSMKALHLDNNPEDTKGKQCFKAPEKRNRKVNSQKLSGEAKNIRQKKNTKNKSSFTDAQAIKSPLLSSLSTVPCQAINKVQCIAKRKAFSSSGSKYDPNTSFSVRIGFNIYSGDVPQHTVDRMGPLERARSGIVSESSASNRSKGKGRLLSEIIPSEAISSTSTSNVKSHERRKEKTLNIHADDLKVPLGTFEVNMQQLICDLKEAVSLLEAFPVYPLYSHLCKLLAILVTLEANKTEQSTLNSAYLLSESCAITLRHKAVTALAKKGVLKESVYSSLNISFPEPTGVLDPTINCANSRHLKEESILRFNTIGFQLQKENSFSNSIQDLINQLPKEWTVIQISVIYEPFSVSKKKTKPNILLSRYNNGCAPCIVGVDNLPAGSLANFNEEFNNIISESKLSMSKKNPAAWWTVRRGLDRRMRILLSDIELTLLSQWKGIMLGLPVDGERNRQVKKLTAQLLSKLPQGPSKEIIQVLIDSASELSMLQISSILTHLCESTSLDLCEYIRKASASLPSSNRHPVILILDPDVQDFPWENISILKDKPVTRVPSFRFLHYHLAALCGNKRSVSSGGINSENTFYLLNPANDLAVTQKVFEKKFIEYKQWKGIIGRCPTSEEFVQAFSDYELFIYLGHGSGRHYLNGLSIESTSCQASVLLMGCSSGKLKRSGPDMEALGHALMLGIGGCPCIIANLWDVTDRDIDRFTEVLLEKWLPNYSEENCTKNVADAIPEARDACKLRYLVGAAPVVYGLPISVQC